MRLLEHHEIQPYEVALVHWENEEINYTVREYVSAHRSTLYFETPGVAQICVRLENVLPQGKHQAGTRELHPE